MNCPIDQQTVVVALGASNLSRGLPRLVAAVRRRVAAPIILAAAGHGRSYGVNSRVAWRRLPSILHCGLWRALDRLTPPTCDHRLLVIITDIGNDLMYGFSVSQTVGWVREGLARLADRGGRLAVTGLPLASVARTGPVRYRLLKGCYVPGCPLPLKDLQTAVVDLDAAVRAVAREYGALVIAQPGEWYGFDTIHVRRRRLDSLWGEACRAWDISDTGVLARASLIEWLRVGRQPAEIRSLAGRVLFTRQPVVCWPDGATLSLY